MAIGDTSRRDKGTENRTVLPLPDQRSEASLTFFALDNECAENNRKTTEAELSLSYMRVVFLFTLSEEVLAAAGH